MTPQEREEHLTMPPYSRDETMQKLTTILQRIVARKVPISEGTLIYHDLSISGDDAWDMLNEIHRQFGTSFNKFEFDAYFPNETESLWAHIGRKLLGHRSNRRKELPVGHLLDVIQQGLWYEPAEMT